MDLSEKKLVVFDALIKAEGIQKLVDVAAEVLGNPVVVTDMGISIIASSSELADDPYWSPERFDASSRDFKQATLSGDGERLVTSDKVVLGDYPGMKERCLAARIRRGQDVLGVALVLERNRRFERDDELLLPDICRIFGYEIGFGREVGQFSERYGRLLEDLLDGRLTDGEEVQRRVQLSRVKVPNLMNVLVARYLHDEARLFAVHLRSQMQKALGNPMSVVVGNDVVCVIDAALGNLGQLIAPIANPDSIVVGMSLSINDLSSLRIAYGQACAAIRLSLPSDGPVSVFRYEDVLPMHLLECASRSCDAATFEHPALELLERIDERDGTDRMGDLDAYLSCGRSAAAASRALHIHLNTMHYRLHRIEELAGIDLSDERICFILQLCLALKGRGSL